MSLFGDSGEFVHETGLGEGGDGGGGGEVRCCIQVMSRWRYHVIYNSGNNRLSQFRSSSTSFDDSK